MDADCSAVFGLTFDIVMTAIKTNTFPKNTEETISSEQEYMIYEFCREILFLSFSIYDLFLLFSADKKIDIKKAVVETFKMLAEKKEEASIDFLLKC